MVWLLHLMRNYDDCNDPKSPLHVPIPREGIENKQCTMFHELAEPEKNRIFI